MEHMEQANRIEVIDQDGWRKEFVLEKRIIYIGSDSRNDIVLDHFRGSGVEHRHLQIITPINFSGKVNAVNLSQSPVYLGEASQRVIPPNSALEIGHKEVLRLGDFVLVVRLTAPEEDVDAPVFPAEVPAAPLRERQTSASIGLRLAMAQSSLNIGAPLEGIISIRNQGSYPAVQFQIKVDGFPEECVELGAAPILFPNAEKNIPLRLHHPRSPALPAGSVRISVRASALEAYPGESASVSREIQVEPYYHHSLQLIEE
jgi:hypothetical protein